MEGGRQTGGRKKIEMKKITDERARLVTFSKRKAGIIKKASELSNQCGAEVGAIIFSPAGKPYAFGSPSIEAVTNRFLNRQAVAEAEDPRISSIMEANRESRLENLNNRHNELLVKIQAAGEKNKSLTQITETIKVGNAANNVRPEWWEVPFDELSPAQVQRMAGRLDLFIDFLCKDLENGAAVSSPVPPPNAAVVDRVVDLPDAP